MVGSRPGGSYPGYSPLSGLGAPPSNYWKILGQTNGVARESVMPGPGKHTN